MRGIEFLARVRYRQRSRGTGPRATVRKTARFTVGRGPVPRHPECIERSRGPVPRATVSRTARLIIGRGPVPRHAPIAGETLSDARMASEGPRATEPETIAWACPPRYGIQNGPFYRRARACPSPCTDREEQALALWARKKKNARGTDPRPTMKKRLLGP